MFSFVLSQWTQGDYLKAGQELYRSLSRPGQGINGHNCGGAPCRRGFTAYRKTSLPVCISTGHPIFFYAEYILKRLPMPSRNACLSMFKLYTASKPLSPISKTRLSDIQMTTQVFLQMLTFLPPVLLHSVTETNK